MYCAIEPLPTLVPLPWESFGVVTCEGPGKYCMYMGDGRHGHWQLIAVQGRRHFRHVNEESWGPERSGVGHARR